MELLNRAEEHEVTTVSGQQKILREFELKEEYAQALEAKKEGMETYLNTVKLLKDKKQKINNNFEKWQKINSDKAEYVSCFRII